MQNNQAVTNEELEIERQIILGKTVDYSSIVFFEISI